MLRTIKTNKLEQMYNNMVNAINTEHYLYIDSELPATIYEFQEVLMDNYANFKIHEEMGTMTYEIGIEIARNMDAAWLKFHKLNMMLNETCLTDMINSVNRFSWQWYQDCIRIRNFAKEYEYVSCLEYANWI